jgi:superfamily II DNA or RNA helicase
MAEKLPTIIDNRGDNTLLHALQRLLPGVQGLDITTGLFEIGSFLLLEQLWQGLDKIRILMGDETTRRTKKEIVESLRKKSDASIEGEKERNDALTGLAAVCEAIASGRIMLRVYLKARFHAKSYLMESKETSPVDFAIVGSSNLTRPGLTENLELNLFSTDQSHIENLRKWYDEIWKEGEDVREEILKVIELHLREYDPFTVYAKALYEFFAGREKTQDEWELKESVLYPKLSRYQKDGYHRALQIADNWRGALICDGVGLGKTFIGLMILERCIQDGKRVLLVVPKSAEKSVWQRDIHRYLEPKYEIYFNEQFKMKRHTDFGREGGFKPGELEYFQRWTDILIIDEAHHFRNPNSNRGELMMELAKDKKLYMLTATPMNNSLDDLYYLINYVSQNKKDYFSKIRIQNLRGHFLENEKRMQKEHEKIDLAEILDKEDFLRTDEFLKHILIQRSRSYVKKSEGITENAPLFPARQKPQVINYSLKNVYENIYGEIREAFDKDKPFLSLAIHNTSAYHKDPDKQKAEYQKLLIGLIRTLLLKRLESSFKAFEASVEDLLAKMAAFLRYFAPELFQAWEKTNPRWWKVVQEHINQRLERDEADTENEEEDGIPDFAEGFNPEEHQMDKLLSDVQGDMNLLTDFLSKIYRRFYVKESEGEQEDPTKDEKLQKLIDLLSTDELLKDQKVIIFTEFRDTARYLARQLQAAGLKNLEQVDSGRNVRNREDIIKRFSPYYNCFDGDKNLLGETELSKALDNPIDILISTDVLSEGLNLQDACLIINYDLHWNPVRLMQRIGRVDRRLNPEIEEMLDRPAHLEGKVYFWNFLPPKELEELLHLKQKLDGKILRINKTLGIEGALLMPDDPEMSLKLFNERYEGKESTEELMNLERQHLEKELPEFWQSLQNLPKRLFSGKKAGDGFGPILNQKNEVIAHLKANDKKGVFACYRMPTIIGPAPKDLTEVRHEKADPAKEQTNEVRWYFWDAETEKVTETLEETWTAVRCSKDTKRIIEKGVTELAPARKAIEKHIKNTYLKDVQAPIGAKPVLLAWMELS